MAALEIATYLPQLVISRLNVFIENPRSDFWFDVSRHVFNSSVGRIESLSRVNREVAFLGWVGHAISIKQFMNWYGVEEIFVNFVYRTFPNSGFVPLAVILIFNLESRQEPEQRRALNQLEEVGRSALSVQLPWNSHKE